MKVEFWINSSRGTNHKEVVVLPDDFTKDDIFEELEDWCSNFGAWHVSENYLRYGWKDVTVSKKLKMVKK
jgi:hypothetical protein